ncbi:MAG: NADH-quinone oxidoreductase subunit NuoE family protein [Planctomycetota bacterium]|jgi:NADH-quinone oxidoreductase subunit E
METDTKLRKFGRVCEIVDKYDRNPSKLIPILQEVQKEYRYLPEEVMTYVATCLDMSPARIYGVASFYANFALEPKGKYVVHICDGTACHVKGSGAIKEALFKKLSLSSDKPTTDDLMFTVEAVSCLGACGLAPVITVNEKVHGQMTVENAEALVDDIAAKEADDA